jgi:hypothetical protein
VITHTLTDRQRDLLRHTLGADNRRPGWRNWFATEQEGEDWRTIQELVAAGLMKRGRDIPTGQLYYAMVYYHATAAGQEAVGIKAN